jgi:hypothetical protein
LRIGFGDTGDDHFAAAELMHDIMDVIVR